MKKAKPGLKKSKIVKYHIHVCVYMGVYKFFMLFICSICGDNLVFSLIILVSQIHTGPHIYLYMCIYIYVFS